MPESRGLRLALSGRRLRLEEPELKPGIAEEDRLVVRRRLVPLRESEDVPVPGDRTGAVGDVERNVLETLELHHASPLVPVSGGPTTAVPRRVCSAGATQLATVASDDDASAVMADRIAEHEGKLGAAIGHASETTRAGADLLDRRLTRAGVDEVLRYRVGPSVGAHTGPHSFGAFWWPVDQAARDSASTHHER